MSRIFENPISVSLLLVIDNFMGVIFWIDFHHCHWVTKGLGWCCFSCLFKEGLRQGRSTGDCTGVQCLDSGDCTSVQCLNTGDFTGAQFLETGDWVGAQCLTAGDCTSVQCLDSTGVQSLLCVRSEPCKGLTAGEEERLWSQVEDPNWGYWRHLSIGTGELRWASL